MKTKSMGSLIKRGATFYAMWRHGGKQFCKALRNEHGASITTLPEAEKAKAKLLDLFAKEDKVELLQGIQRRIDNTKAEIESQTPGLSIKAAWSAFAKPSSGRKSCGLATLGNYESRWTQFQTWMESEHPEIKTLAGVKREIARAYLDNLIKRGLSFGTVNEHMALMRYIWKVLSLSDENKLTDNVWTKFPPLQVARESRRELTVDELTLICSKAQGEMKVAFCVGIYTGLRLGDVATLEWSEVDLQRNVIRLVPNKISRRKGQKGLIQIPIHPILRDVLLALPGDKINGHVLPEMAALYLAGRRYALTHRIQAHFADCGIETNKKREQGLRAVVDVGFHSLRHTFVSMCAMGGVPLSVLQSLVGHSSPAMTMHYSHSNRVAEQNAIAALPAIAA